MASIRNLSLTSPDFPPGGRIPDRLSAAYDNDLPILEVDGVPEEAIELAVICHDPDAREPGGFTHWTLYGVPARSAQISLAELGSAREGMTDAGRRGWHGPKPPKGDSDHRYHFWVYALDAPVEGEPTRDEFLQRYADHIVDQAYVIGTYSR